MIANSAFLAAMTLLLISFVLMGELTFLAPYKRVIAADYAWTILSVATVLFLNLMAIFYLAGRALFLKETAPRKTGAA